MAVNRMGRLVGAVLVAVVMLGACTSGASPSAAGSQGAESAAPGGLKIGVTFPILDQFLQTVADGMEAKATELGVTLNIVAAQEKTDVQLGQVENFISQEVDAIVVIPVDTDAAGPMTEKAAAASIPLVYVNRRPSDLPTGVPYVGSDSLYAGTVEMEALAELVDGKGNVVILQGDPAN